MRFDYNAYDHPLMDLTRNRVPHGKPYVTYTFSRIKDGHHFASEMFDVNGYQGYIFVSADVFGDKLPSDGDVVSAGLFRLRVIEYQAYLDRYLCSFDTPIGTLLYWRVKLHNAGKWVIYRLFATARIWGLIDIDMEYDGVTKWGLPKVTRILWHKVDKRTTV